MKRSLPFWQFSGYVFTALAGTLLHFVYDWSGGSIVAALFSAVNESIWEHMKLLYFPALLFAFFQSRFFAKDYPNFWYAKLMGTLFGLVLIPVLYYTYTGALGVYTDWFNILIFFIAAALGFVLETKIMQSGKSAPLSPALSRALLVGIGILFIVFTFSPPHIPLFRNPQDGTYGYPL